MHFTEDDAAFMYARACRAWYGSKAKHVVSKRIKELQQARPGARRRWRAYMEPGRGSTHPAA
jgi:hypothetical protein